MAYALAERRVQFRVAAENPAKLGHLRDILRHYGDGRVLVIGEYLDQVEAIAKEIGAPLVTGKTAQAERERVYEQFRQGELRRIVLSKVGNFAVDLPDADVLIQVSGAFGSRQEEAQRPGTAPTHRRPRVGPRVRRVVKRVDGKPLIEDATFDVASAEFAPLLGPSGCGKTIRDLRWGLQVCPQTPYTGARGAMLGYR